MKKRIIILIQFLALTSLFWCATLNAQSKAGVVVTAENPMGGGRLLTDSLQVTRIDSLKILSADSLQILPVDSLKVSPIDTLKLSYCDSLVNARIDTLSMNAVDSARVADSIMGLPDTLRNSRTIFALKTNLLYDLATVVNYSLEIPIGNRVSILFQHYIPWWRASNNKYCLELQSLGAEARFWIKPKENERLSGHFLGLYALSGTTDLQYDRELDIQAKFWSAGLTYGYSFVLNHSLRLELSISGGYLRAPLTQYFPADDYSILFKDVDFHNTLTWIGPTKVEVSFVWSINAAKKNKAKEGRQ